VSGEPDISRAGGRVTTAASATSVATTTPVSNDREALLIWNDLSRLTGSWS
jgi:hypothetical protein